MLTPLILIALAVLVGAEDSKKAPTELEGVWQLLSGITAGDRVPDEETTLYTAVLRGNMCTWMRRHRTLTETTFRLDPTAKPKQVDLVADPRHGVPTLGIYELEGDTLKMCFALEGGPRPRSFEPTTGNRQTIRTYTRKPDARELEGSWEAVAIEYPFGGVVRGAAAADSTWIIQGDKVVCKFGNKITGKMTIRLYAKANPKLIEGTEEGAADVTMRGTYELDGDTLRITGMPAGTARPTSFFSGPGPGSSGLTTLLLKRKRGLTGWMLFLLSLPWG